MTPPRVTVGCLGACAVVVSAVMAPIVLAQPDQGAILDRLGEIRRETGAPGVMAAVAVEGTVIFAGGVGWAELENQVPASGVTVHNIGSVSKVVTTVAVMQLAEQSQLKLDDRLQHYIPTLPAGVEDVTLRHVLTHTSGLRLDDGREKISSFDELVEATPRSPNAPLLFSPGSFWAYSSYAFNLLQAVIESVSGGGFEDYLQLNVWGPAGMGRTSLDIASRIVPRRGSGYKRGKGGTHVNSPSLDLTFRYAADGMLSTVQDLVRLGVAINANVLVKPGSVATMHSSQLEQIRVFPSDGAAPEGPTGQAIGWFINEDEIGRNYLYHTGMINGVSTALINYPAEHLVIALIANILPFDAHKAGQSIAGMYP